MKPFLLIRRTLFISTLLLIGLGYNNVCVGQVSLYTTNFGTTTAFPTGWTPSTADWTNKTDVVSSGYTGASGGSNPQFLNNNTTAHTLTYSNTLSTVGYQNITLLWGARQTGAATITVTLSWSSNGSTWNNVSFTNVTNNSTWALVNSGTRIALPAGAAGIANLRLRLSAIASVSGGTSSYRMDDFTVEGDCQGISQIPTSNLILNYKFTGNANDEDGTNNGTLQNAPALTTDRFSIASRAYSFNGSTQYVTTANSYLDPVNFSISIWFKTATASGGMLIGFGSAQTGSSGSHDRKIYMNNAGQIYFGVYNGATVTVNSTLSYNDNNWHLATATLSSTAGMILYMDGVQVATNANTAVQNYTGYWRIGYDALSGWPSTHTSNFFNGTLDDALVYHGTLNSTQVATIYNSPDGAGDNGPVCAGSSLNLTATTVAGATYAWTGPNSFTSSSQNPTLTYTSAYAGVYTVQVTSGSCTSSAYTNVTTAATSSTISYAGSPYCKNAGTASVTFAGTAGGTYSSTAGLSISSTTGAVTLSTSTAGTYTVTYTVAGGCTATTGIIVTAVPSATISYAGSPYYVSGGTGTVTFSGTAGGTYSSTAGLSINSGTGAVTLGTSTPAAYTVTYTVAAAGGCTLYTTTAGITVLSNTKTWDGGAATNNWGDAANWNADGLPTSSDNVDLTGANTININVAATTNNLLLNNASLILTINSGNTLTVSGNLTLTSGTLNTANAFPTVTGTVNVAGGTVGFTGSGTQTIPAYSYNNLTINKSAGTGSLGGTTTIAGNLTITAGTFDLGTFTINRASAGGTLTISSGSALKIGGTNTIPSNYTTHSIAATGTIEYSGTTQSVIVLNSAQNYGNLIISGSGTKTLAGTNNVAGDLTVAAGTFDLGSFTANRASAGGTLSVASSATLKIGGTNTFPSNYSTHSIAFVSVIEYGGTNQTVGVLNSAQEYSTLTISGSGTKTLTADLNVAGTLNLNSGTITTGVYTLYSKVAGNVFRVSGWVIGNLKRRIPTGSPTRTFDVGDATNYTPITLVFTSITTAGDLTVSTTSGDHANIGTSTINSAKSVNRTWTLINSGLLFATYGATFTFVAGDLDAGATTSNFIVGKYNSGWTYPTVGTKTSTTTQATGITTFGDFQVGELCPTPTTSAAGADQTGAATCGSTTVTLAGNIPSVGTGAWSIISGTGGTVTTPSSATSTFSGTAGTSYTLRWTISSCTASTDDVVITFNQNPTVSAAGADQTGAATCGSTTVTLAANVPAIGTGAWSIVSGTGGTVTTPTSAVSTFTGTAGTTYTLRWTISNSPCTASTDDVVITFNQNPTSVSGTATETCVGGSTGTITASASGGTTPYTYSLNAGAYQASAIFTGLAAATYTLNVKSNAGCVTSNSVTVSPYANSTDDQNATATDTWIGHMYDGTNFTSYIGQFTEAETFNELFGGTAVCFNVVSNSVTRSIYTETFSVKFKMNSTKRGLYVVDLGSDDGSRFTVDGTMVYNNWSDQGISTKPGVLMNLDGASSLMYEFYENGGGNQVLFQNLTLVLANTLSTNTTQSICIGNTGSAISGDVYGTLPAGITLSGTGYQWSYSTTPGGARTNIAGETTSTFTPSASVTPFNAAGTYYIYRNSVLSSANNISPNPYVATNESNAAIITVTALPSATISYSGSPFCISVGTGQPVTQTGTAGGTYSSTAGLTINAGTGAITPNTSTAGTYTVTYTMAAAGGCSVQTATASVTITALPSATISYSGSPFCITLATGQPVTQTGTAGGTYSSTAGLTINAGTGAITPNTSTAGTYTVTYTMAAAGGCSAQTATASVTITTLPSATISYSGSPFCITLATGQPVTHMGTAGGTYTSTAGLTINAGTGAITPVTSTAGTYTVTYTMAAAGGCVAQTATASVTITTLPSATISYSGTPFCTSVGTPQPVTQTGTAGGTYTSTAGLTINAGTGSITPGTSIAGTYTITYTMAAAGGCVAQTATASVTITALPSATISYSGTPFCTSVGTGQPVTQTGTAGGTYTSTAGLTINASTGSITPNTSTAGTYTITYTMASAGGCAAQTATASVTITALPSATISYSGTPFCISVGSAQPVTQTGTAGGTYTSTAGLTINASTGTITPNTSTAGTYTITYTMASAGGCSAQTATASVTITALPSATISYSGTPFCTSVGSAQPVTQTGTAGGTYTSTAGLTINASTGTITPNTSTAGTYTITYTMAAVGGCSAQTATTSVTITALPSATISYSGTPFCRSLGTGQAVTQTGTSGGVYSSTAGLSIDPSTGAIIPGTSTEGIYTVTYTMAAAAGCSAQTATTSVTISAIPAATISYPGSPYTVNGGTASVTFSGTVGGTYSSTAGLSLNATTGDVTLITSTLGTYSVTYTVAAAGGCSVFTTTATITIITTTKTFTGTGNFSDPLRWTGGTLPTAAENLVIDGTCTVDNNAGTDNIAYGTLTIGTATGRTLSWIASGTNRLNVSNVSAGAAASTLNMTNGGTLVIRGTWASTNLTFTSGAGTIELQSTITLPATYATYKHLIVNGQGITVTLGRATTIAGNLTITAGTLKANNFATTAKGNWTNNVSTTAFTAGTSTVTFNNTIAQSIGGTFGTSFTNLTITNTGNTVSLNVNASITGNLSVTIGTFDLGIYTANRATAGGTLSLSNNTFLKIGGTNTFPTNFTTNTLAIASTVEYYGANQTVAAKTYGNLTLSSGSGAAVKTLSATAFAIVGNFSSTLGAGSSVTFTAASILTITGNVNIGASTTFNGGSFSHSIAGNWVNSGTFNGNTGTISFTGPGKNVSGSGTQNFNNLTVAASAVTFSNGSISLSGNLATTGSGSFIQASGGTLLMTGSGKTISGTGISLDNLTINGSVSTSISLTVTGNLSVSGSFTASAGTITMSGASKTISGAGTIGFAGLTASGSVTTAVNFSISSGLTVSGSLSASAGTVTFTGTSSLNGTADLFNITINGTSLQLSSNSTLGIANALTITAGILNVTSSIPNTVNFNGTGAQNINAISYNDLILSNGNTKTAAGAITTNNDLTIGTSTTFTASSYTHSIYGDWINNGTFIAGTSTVEFAGPGNAQLTGATTFNILTSNTSSITTELTLQSNVSAAIVNMTNGLISTGTNTLTITNTRTGIGFIHGNIQRTHSFTTGVAYAFEGPDNTISFSAVSGVNSITVFVAEQPVADFPFGNAIGRYYDITVPSGTYTATLRLHYEDDELNGNPENDMGMWNYDSTQWLPVGKTANDSTANYVEQSGLTNITNRWTCSINPTVVLWSGAVSSDWNTAANWTVYVGSGSTPPAATDVVVLGGLPFTYQPTISTTVNIKNLVFTSTQAVTLSMAGGGSLTAGDMQGVWYNNALHTINTNGQTITINGNMSLSDGVTGHDIDLNIGSGTVSVLGSLIHSGGAAINFSGAGTLSIHENYDLVSGTFNAGNGTVIYNGDQNQHVAHINYNNLTINKTAGFAAIDSVVNIAGDLLISSGELDNASIINITGNVTIAPGTTLHNNYMLHVGGNWNNTGNYIATGAHIVFNGSGTQTISSTTFNNLEFHKPAASLAVLTGDVTINGNLIGVSGTLDIGSFFFNRLVVGGSATMSDSATLIIGADNAPNKFANYSMSPNSTVIFNGTGTQHLLLPGMVYGNIIFRNAGNKILYTPTTINGDLTIENGSAFDAGSQTITLNGNWINNGTFTPSTSTIVCTGIGKTISGVTTFKRFSVYGSYTILSDLTFDSLLNINSTGSITSGTSIQTTINGDIINSGVVNATGTTTITGNVEQHISLINAATTVLLRLIINGSVSPVINSTAPAQYGYITINNTAGVTAATGVTVLFGLTIGPGAIFNGGNSAHNILGDVTNNGTLTSTGTLNFIPSIARTVDLGSGFSSTGIVNFGGAGALTLASNPLSFHDVEISNTNSAGIIPASDWTIENNFTVNSGAIFNAGNHAYSVGGSVSNSGTVNSGTSTFSFNGTTNQTIDSMIFYNLDAMNSGGLVTLLDATVNNNLSVTTGTLSIGDNTAVRTIAVGNNITIAGGAILNVDSTSNATHLLTVSGNIINSGTLNLRTDANSLCNTTFNKVGTQTISGTGGTTNFNNITVNMGVADTNHLDVTATNFSAPNGFLTLNNGSFNLNSATTAVTPFTTDISTGNFLIPATAGLWVNAGTINSANMNWTVAGSVRVTGGTMNMGSVIDNVVIPKPTGNFKVTAGNLNLASRISNPGATWSYIMQGGVMTVNTQGSTTAGAASFNMDATGSAFNMSGGTIVIRDAGGTTGQNIAYNNLSTTGTGFTGGTLQIGNILTTASQRFGIVSTNPIYNLTVNSTNATAILQTPVLAVSNNVTITLGTLNIDTLALKIGGAISNGGTFIAANGTIEMNGTSAQTIPAATFVGNNLKGLTINNNAGVTLGGALNLTDVLTVSNGSLAAGGYLTLKSSATATARVAAITSAAATPISGNVIAERYVQGRRKYRLITSPVTTSTGSTLSAGQESLSIWGNWQNSGINTTPNVGELITGGTIADGFDAGTTNASLYTYDDVNRVFKAYSTANGKNTKYTPLKAGIAYLMFVYGDRQNSVVATNPHNTVLNATGTLKTGDQTYNTGSAIPLTGVTGRFTLLGNPFASPINWATIPKADLDNAYWGWDPNLGGTGGYITVTTLGNVTIQAPYSGSTGLNQYIQSGQGIFVKTTGPSPVLTIREQDKVSNFNANAYRGDLVAGSIPLLAVNLQYVSSGTKVLADGVLAVFDPAFPNAAGAEDATKMANTAESMAILNGITALSIDARQMPNNNDTLFLNVSRLTKPQYSLQIFTEQMAATGVTAFLQDRYLNTLQPLSLSDTNNIVINVSAGIPASSDINRFRIVFHSSLVILPLKFISIKAIQKNKDIQIDWVVAEESGLKKYEIDRSADGIIFNKIGEVAAIANNSTETYHWLDVNTISGNNYYRVRAVQLDGNSLLSPIVVVKMNKGTSVFKIFPNPVTEHQLKIRADEMAKGKYSLVLYNQQGQQTIQRVIDHRGGAFNQVIDLRMLPAGIYYLQITGEKEKYSQTIYLE